MNGISGNSILFSMWRSPNINQANNAVITEAAQADVMPVAKTKDPSSSIIPIEYRLPTVEDLNNPSEMIARMRIQYLGNQESEPVFQTGLELGLKGRLSELETALGYEKWTEGTENAIPPLGVEENKSAAQIVEEAECQTCAKRKYQDGSDDPGVSFKTPTKISPEQAASAVRGHEQEHVVRERAEAEQEGRKVVNQSVTIHTEICPECGRVYVSGGVTRTVTAEDKDLFEEQQKDISNQDTFYKSIA